MLQRLFYQVAKYDKNINDELRIFQKRDKENFTDFVKEMDTEKYYSAYHKRIVYFIRTEYSQPDFEISQSVTFCDDSLGMHYRLRGLTDCKKDYSYPRVRMIIKSKDDFKTLQKKTEYVVREALQLENVEYWENESIDELEKDTNHGCAHDCGF